MFKGVNRMEKIAILTIVSENCGNRLQNYALQQTLKNMGYNVYTIQRKGRTLKFRIKQVIRSCIVKDYHSSCFWFNRKIQWTRQVIPEGNLKFQWTDCYDRYVIGSDQIWNVTFDFIGENDFLPSIEKQKKCSYAASFGITRIPQNQANMVAKMLSQVDSISVREDAGKRIVEDLTDQTAEVVLDPTLLLDSSQWAKIERKPYGMSTGKFIFTYILGCDDAVEGIEAAAQKKGVEVVSFDGRTGTIGPAEFIYCVHHAEAVCTDSFHASVFSMMFKKKFIILRRNSSDVDMYSRLDTLCDTFELESHKCSTVNLEDLLNQSNSYERQFEILQNRKKESLDFLTSALEK